MMGMLGGGGGGQHAQVMNMQMVSLKIHLIFNFSATRFRGENSMQNLRRTGAEQNAQPPEPRQCSVSAQ